MIMINNIPSPIVNVFWIVLGILSVVALLGNGFIVAVISHPWLQTGRMAPCDFLLTGLSTSRFLLQLISLLGYPAYFNVSQSNVYCYILQVMNVTWFFFGIVNLWCATWLSIFYCVKVASFPTPLFLWLKTRIDVIVLRLLGLSIIVSMVLSVPSYAYYYGSNKRCDLTGIHPANNSQMLLDEFNSPLLVFLIINFILNITASTLLLTSLWMHTRNLRKSGTALNDLGIRIHIKVMKFLLFYLFFYILFGIGMIFSTANIFKFGTPERLVTEILLSTFSSAHSALLILTNPKLKKASARILKIRFRSS